MRYCDEGSGDAIGAAADTSNSTGYISCRTNWLTESPMVLYIQNAYILLLYIVSLLRSRTHWLRIHHTQHRVNVDRARLLFTIIINLYLVRHRNGIRLHGANISGVNYTSILVRLRVSLALRALAFTPITQYLHLPSVLRGGDGGGRVT